jgi:hypothetical protein
MLSIHTHSISELHGTNSGAFSMHKNNEKIYVKRGPEMLRLRVVTCFNLEEE